MACTDPGLCAMDIIKPIIINLNVIIPFYNAAGQS